jgi:hypothetical protein
MPNAAEHQAKVAHNLAFLQTINDPAYCDWMAVVTFYTAVHLVEQLFALKGQHSQDHRGRNQNVRKNLRQIHQHYRPLYNLSMVARYQQAAKFNLNAATVKAKMIDHHLQEITKFVTAQLNPQPPIATGTGS